MAYLCAKIEWTSMLIDKIVLLPYYLTLKMRHILYDRNIYKIYRPEIPSVCVGNVTVGGTGKTPMVELLVSLYVRNMRVAVVSRGYGRRTKGFRMVEASDDYRDTGDEPLQIKRKFPDLTVAVDSSRKRALETLMNLAEGRRPELVLLDDAFQHRKVKAGFSIVLISSHRPTFEDRLLPLGRLRDLPSRVKKADMVIVTKVDHEVAAEERQLWRSKLQLPAGIPLLFSKTVYEPPKPVFPDACDNRYLYSKKAVLFSGIADDSNFRREVGWNYEVCGAVKFGDHHAYSDGNLAKIDGMASKHPTAVVLTTEKDAQRLIGTGNVSAQLKAKMFYIPIKTEIIPEHLPERCIEEEMAGLGEQELKAAVKLQ